MGAAAAILGGSALSAGAGIFGSLMSSKAVTSAAQNAQNLQATMWQQAMNIAQPFVSAGSSVIPTLQKLLTPGPDQTATLSQLPGFQFAQNVGTETAINQNSRLGGGGNTLTSLEQFGTGLAQQNWTQYLAPLLTMFQGGAGAATSLAGNAVTSGSNQASSLLTGGQAAASGIAGATNAAGNFGGNIGQLFALNQ